MYSLKEIRQYQENRFNFINDEANKIHRKLLRPISMREILDPDFDAAHYQEQYNKLIEPLVTEYNKTIDKMVKEHVKDFLEGWVCVHPDGHFATNLANGKYCTIVEDNVLNNGELMYDVEISDYIQTIREIPGEYNIKPFWSMTHCITYEGKREYIYGNTTASDYIDNARYKLAGVKNTFQQLLDIAQTVNDLPNVNVPPISDDLSYSIHNSALKKIVQHHTVLYKFFEIYGTGNDEDGKFYSMTRKDGSIDGFVKH